MEAGKASAFDPSVAEVLRKRRRFLPIMRNGVQVTQRQLNPPLGVPPNVKMPALSRKILFPDRQLREAAALIS